MFRGCSTLSVDNKGRLAVPSRYRERLICLANGNLILTLNPLDRSLWLYPLPEWELIESKLAELSDFDRQGRRAKQMMRGYATDCQLDSQGRILIPHELREYASLGKHAVILGQGNKFEIWDEKGWKELREDWLTEIGKDTGEPSDALKSLSL
ncbi:MAG: cell division/cell wall cluster transcriptional repressor MraZ [Gammaproteobacteria bacterium RIFCSPLOWO2_02_FULL_47_50]|nr:MAG: cell division/cell wall cluster transcriptional repressor MraZ [Gammaproteobacteria bacterium RIFCSPLOWO2_01_FULL_47_190]OGT64739.1 MAG: cell division/cell wall cluster transcriptional repressor MraZ [Gammaproteobacteria bacterium RIFCSPLOWO2_02_47_7]OGT72598.1 MAG: cell division/cell wall cluster transcriptional repressor MraZ [Gammaproteobacteria bacterium RIFCSPLOWO2_12_47_11]OGT78721.1 MAG: cell division/cell wall cluster transcriptional repressor MraZ [Gammaproteobacteria bacterium 